MDGPTEIRIVEAYRDYEPSFNVKKTVYKLLCTVPGKYLKGLDCVVLLNESGLARRDRLGEGPVTPAQTGEIARPWPVSSRVSQQAPLYRTPSRQDLHKSWQSQLSHSDCEVARVRPRSISRNRHHIHHTVRPEHREKEDVADDWAGKLNANMIRRRYWYLMPILMPVSKLYRLLRRRRWI